MLNPKIISVEASTLLVETTFFKGFHSKFNPFLNQDGTTYSPEGSTSNFSIFPQPYPLIMTPPN